MSTPDASGLPPAEAQLVAAQVPRPGEVPSSPSFAGSSPGAATAGARVPGGPTLPEPDASLAAAIGRLANELFAPAPPAAVTTSFAPPGPALTPAGGGFAPGAQPQPSSPTLAEAPTSMPGGADAPRSPWDAPLRFDALPGFDAPPGLEAPRGFDVPLLDGGPSFDVAGATTPATPYWITAPAAPAPRLAFPEAHQHDTLAPGAPTALRSSTSGTPFDPHAVKREFPILDQRVNGKPLVWLDNAATTQKPQAVIDRLVRYYAHENSNIHRAAHTLAARATDAYESARETVRRFINAPAKQDIVFVRGATEGINLVAQSWGRRHVREGDEIVLSHLEHHANIVPWQMLASEKGAKLRVAPVDDSGQIILAEYEKLLGPRTRLVAFTQVSNALGTITPAAEMIALAHRHGARVLLDGAQSVSHQRVDVQALDADFFVFSGHKIFAPTGIGAVYGKASEWEGTPPWQGGGNMIKDVTFERSLYQDPPGRFEAGTGNIADAVGLGAALDWLSRLGVDNVGRYEHGLLEYATERLRGVPGLRLVGTAAEKAGVISFVLAGQKTEEVGGLLDQEGIAVRSGHHCAQPILRRFGLEATVRASLAPYNTCEDIDALARALHRLQVGHSAPRSRILGG